VDVIKSDNSVVNQLVDYLKDNGGSASAAEICRDVMGLDNCDPILAKQLVTTGLPEDHRILLDNDGLVRLARKSGNGNTPIRKGKFVVIDVEATSLPKPNNRIMELAAIQLDFDKMGRRFETLVNPTVSIPKYVQQITGINNEMVASAPTFAEVADDIRNFIGDRVIVAHNSAFDVGIINSELKRIDNTRLLNPSLCTVQLSRKLIPGLDRYRLGEVAKYFNIDIENRHRATDDTVAAAKILINLMEIALEQGKEYLSDLIKLGGLKKKARW
jgi:DNA polymerase III epsilon subunit family exonuclease